MKVVLKIDNCAGKLPVIAKPEMLRIIQFLPEGPKSVGDVGATTREQMGNVPYHIKTLREASIVEAVRDGRFVRYRIARSVWLPAKSAGVDYLDIGC